MKITSKIFEEKTKVKPEHDDLERCNCSLAGEVGHYQCGWCQRHDKPRFLCGCLVTKRNELINYSNAINGDFFLTTDHCQAEREDGMISGEGWVPCTYTLPFYVKPRKGYEKNAIESKQDYILFQKSCKRKHIQNPNPKYQG